MTDIRWIMLPVLDPRHLVGRPPVELSDVEVRAPAGQRGVWIGPALNGQLLVLADDPTAAQTVDRLKLTKGEAR